MKGIFRFLLAMLSGSLPAAAFPAEPRPNIILIYSDDHGFADLGAQGVDPDIRTPHLDALARDGVRFLRGYVSAPQCVPSRAGVITGRYQQRFGVEDNSQGPLPLAELTLAERLKPAGYVSCQIGKWHLEPPPRKGAGKESKAESGGAGRAFLPLGQGFEEYCTGPMNTFVASHDPSGNRLANAPQTLTDMRFRCVWQADAAVSFIDRHAKDPFFLYLAFFAPHVPLESPEPWFSQTDPTLPKERRQALAMIASMDDGIGRIRAKLGELGIDKNTLLFFIGDNGAPTKEGAWDGSLNLPLVGEKGMLTDGGIRVPFVAAWPGTLPAGMTYENPVINLDVAATAVALAGLPQDDTLDGVNLVPYLLGEKAGQPHAALFWRWRSQAAIRADHWKYIRVGPEERYLFDLSGPEGRSELAENNLITRFPEIAAGLEQQLMAWNATLPPPGLPRESNAQDAMFYDAHVKLTGITATKHGKAPAAPGGAPASGQNWVVRNAAAAVNEDTLRISPDTKGKQQAFVAFSGLDIRGPGSATVALRSEQGGQLGVAWRLDGQKDFPPGQTVRETIGGSLDFQTVTLRLPAEGKIIHLRLLLPDGTTDLRRIELKSTSGDGAWEGKLGSEKH